MDIWFIWLARWFVEGGRIMSLFFFLGKGKGNASTDGYGQRLWRSFVLVGSGYLGHGSEAACDATICFGTRVLRG